jgi:hypothetical protein
MVARYAAGCEDGNMIAASAGVKVMVATKPVDFPKDADGLAALVWEQLRHDPFLCVEREYVAAWPRVLNCTTILGLPSHNIQMPSSSCKTASFGWKRVGWQRVRRALECLPCKRRRSPR